MKNKLYPFALAIFSLMLLASCGHPNIGSKDEAVKFLETNNFSDDGATVTGQSGGKVKSSFSMSFQNGNAMINGESMPYKISEEIVNGNAPGYNANSFNGYEIEFCGSQRYAYGGCIKCYLTSGKTSKNGPSLTVRGDYIHAYFSNISKDGITKK
jgi:hypothetical protein